MDFNVGNVNGERPRDAAQKSSEGICNDSGSGNEEISIGVFRSGAEILLNLFGNFGEETAFGEKIVFGVVFRLGMVNCGSIDLYGIGIV